MFDVKLHAYDLSQGMAAQYSRSLLGKHIEGVWHTGLVVYGKEYYFGGGVSYDPPGMTPFGRPSKTIDLGFTEITEDLFMEFLREISPRFTQETYNVLKHNCNNFTNECSNFLLGNDIPKYIIDLPNEVLNTPLGRMFGPMIEQMQDNLKVNSHQLFNTGGQQQPLINANPSSGGGMGFGGGMPGGFGGQASQQNPNAAAMNDFVNMFAQQNLGGAGGAGMGGMGNAFQQQQQQQPSGFGQAVGSSSAASDHGGVIQIQNLQQLQQLIKESPGVAIDFWSPQCPPCLRIKPVFESLAKSNDNDNLKFAAVNTQQCRDCAMSFHITSIPQFYFYLNGQEFKQFKGAREDQLLAALSELSEMTKTRVSQHKSLNYRQFRPMNLAPQGFTSMNMIEKMKEFVQGFVQSAEVQKEAKSTQKMQKWLEGFKLESMPKDAIDELMEMVDIAEDKNKIALIDLIRLLMLHEHSAAHILNKHWQCFEVSIFGYMQCMDIKDPEQKIIQNYHLICLKMLGNIYQTDSGKEYMQGRETSESLINFLIFSLDSVNPKVVFTAAVVLFNHILCFKREKSIIEPVLKEAVKKIIQIIADPALTDVEALMGLLLCECRILYQNKQVCEFIEKSLEAEFKKNHQQLKQRIPNPKVKEAVEDVLLMLFD